MTTTPDISTVTVQIEPQGPTAFSVRVDVTAREDDRMVSWWRQHRFTNRNTFENRRVVMQVINEVVFSNPPPDAKYWPCDENPGPQPEPVPPVASPDPLHPPEQPPVASPDTKGRAEEKTNPSAKPRQKLSPKPWYRRNS